MDDNLALLYEEHHKKGLREGFSIYEKERGKWLVKHIGKKKQILDLGCRDGKLTQWFVEGNEVIGVDIDKRLLKKAQKNLNIKTQHLNVYEEWPFKKSFDVIVAGEILEHLYNPEKIVEKAYSLLKPGGMLLVTVPNAYIISARIRFLFGQEIPAHKDPTHINLFTEKKLATMLKKTFKKVDVTGISPPIYKPFHSLSNSLFADDLLAVAWK